MTLEEFVQSTEGSEPPSGLNEVLRALWYAHKGEWDRSHEIAQEVHDDDGSWVHAHLHREEGDIGNARYWYARAGKPESSLSLEEERLELIRALLEKADAA